MKDGDNGWLAMPDTGREIIPANRVTPARRSGAWRLVGDPLGPLGDRGQIAGIDQFVRLKTRKSARTGNRQAHRGHGVRVRQVEDRHAVVLPEHPVIRLRLPPADSATSRTAAARSEGFATNRFAVSLVRLNRTGYLATTTAPPTRTQIWSEHCKYRAWLSRLQPRRPDCPRRVLSP